MGKHASHQTRFSFDASSFDEICVNCNATDQVPGGWGALAEPCSKEYLKVAKAAYQKWKETRRNGSYDDHEGFIAGWQAALDQIRIELLKPEEKQPND